jgi:23S rRNA (guanosine2251-2'-O)-methyltransferase
VSDDGEYLYGINSVAAAVEDGAAIGELRVAEGHQGKRIGRLVAAAKERGIRVRRVPRADLDRRAGGARHQGVVARLEAVSALGFPDLQDRLDALETPLLLLLDGVTDPRNLGACLRTAEAAGAHAVVVPRDRRAPLNAAARKTASGAAERVPLVEVPNLARAMQSLQERGIWLVGTSGAGETPWDAVDAAMPLAWVLGAEGEGMRDLTARRCDQLAVIPMAGKAESLNVSVATGVVLFEALRQRRAAGLA